MDIARVLKKKRENITEQEQIQRSSNKILIFIIVFVGFVFAIDYALVLKFIDILKKL